MNIINKLLNKKNKSSSLKNKDFFGTKETGMNGRTMMEMLGVLAIIGVLSIGAIAGYSYGMTKYKSTVTLQDVNMRMIDIMNQVYQDKSDINIPRDWAMKGRAGYIIDLFQNSDSEPSIMVKAVPTDICKEILKSADNTQDIFVGVQAGDVVNGTWYLGNNEDICEGSDKEILFALSPDVLSGFNPDGDAPYDPESSATIEVSGIECYSNTDCRPDKPYCSDSGRCVKCTQNNHCGKTASDYCLYNECYTCAPETPYWNDTYRICGECLDNSYCTDAATPLCNVQSGKCVACLTNSDCGSTVSDYCLNGTCGVCAPETPYWNSTYKICGECLNNTHCANTDKPYCNPKTGKCTLCYGQPNGKVCELNTENDYEEMCYGNECVDWCGPCPLVGSCWVSTNYCKNKGGKATVYELMLISDNPLYCKNRREAGYTVSASYGSTVYTYEGECPTTDRYKRLWRTMCPACTPGRNRIVANVDRVEVNMTAGSLSYGECGSGNWWILTGCSNDVQAVIKAYDAANPPSE